MPAFLVLRVDRVGVGPVGVHGEHVARLVEAAVAHVLKGAARPAWLTMDAAGFRLKPVGWFVTLAAVQAGRAVLRMERE